MISWLGVLVLLVAASELYALALEDGMMTAFMRLCCYLFYGVRDQYRHCCSCNADAPAMFMTYQMPQVAYLVADAAFAVLPLPRLKMWYNLLPSLQTMAWSSISLLNCCQSSSCFDENSDLEAHHGWRIGVMLSESAAIPAQQHVYCN